MSRQRSRRSLVTLVGLLALLGTGILVTWLWGDSLGGLAIAQRQALWIGFSLLALLLILLTGIFAYEEQRTTTKETALVATLGALAGVARVPFALLPSVQPTTFLIIYTGAVFGPAAGFITGVLAALVSDLFLGFGFYAPWQMVAWGGIGALSGLLGDRKHSTVLFVVWGMVASLLFGWFVDISTLLSGYEPTLRNLVLVILVAGTPFNIAHMLSTAVFVVVLGPSVWRILTRFKERFRVQWAEPLASGQPVEVET